MKKIIVLSVSVLFSTLVFANGTDDASTGASSVAVSNANGSNVVKVFYKAERFGNVKITILNEREGIVFSERLRKTDGFMRPYNFAGLREGEYTIKIEDAFGTHTEKVNYSEGRIKTVIHFAKLAGDDSRYVLTGRSYNEEKIVVRIYDTAHQLVFEQGKPVEGEFGEVYNLKNIPGSFTVEVSDSRGVLKTIQY